jgi:hypothetical protein
MPTSTSIRNCLSLHFGHKQALKKTMVKVEIKFYLCLIKLYAIKTYGRVDVCIHVFLISARPGRFIPGERAPGTHWIGGWVGPRAGLDDVKK